VRGCRGWESFLNRFVWVFVVVCIVLGGKDALGRKIIMVCPYFRMENKSGIEATKTLCQTC